MFGLQDVAREVFVLGQFAQVAVHVFSINPDRLVFLCAGDIAGAWEASRKAKTWAIWSALSGPVLILIWFMFFGGLAMLGAISGAH